VTTLLSYGLGVDSTAILLNWLENPASRRYTIRTRVGKTMPPKFRKLGEKTFDLSDLTVLTAMTGDEFPDLKDLVETHILPRLRAHGVRYVQVARASMKEKLSVLDDSTSPYTLHLAGDFKLSDELLLNGTVPQYRKGSRRCSLKYKGDPLDMWVRGFVGTEPFSHALGFDASEHSRVVTDLSYSRGKRWGKGQKTSFYPLFDWGWTRSVCEAFIKEVTGVDWPKSACAYCPFTMGEDPVMQRFRQYPDEAAKSIFIEYVSMALNHRQSLYPEEQTLLMAVYALGLSDVLQRFEDMLNSSTWGLYWIRRIYYAPQHAYRSVRILQEGDRASIQGVLLPSYGNVSLEGGIPRVISIPRICDTYPVLEETLTAAPRTVEPKDTFKGYDEKWELALAGDWSFLSEKYRPSKEEAEEEEEEEPEGEESEAEHELGGRRAPVSISGSVEDDSRKDEKKWLCQMSDILKTPYIPDCPV
jgi:hypothetical protein